MATTIQNIELPKKPRARDTSNGWQVVGSNLIVNGDFATGDFTGWYESVSDGGVKSIVSDAARLDATAASNSKMQIYQDVVTEGSSYRVTFTVTNYNGDTTTCRVINTAGALLYHITANGPHTFDFTHSVSSGNVFFRADQGGKYDIDDISILKLENFPNNNHGEIYSGRGLEFDGVTDYLTAAANPDLILGKTSHTLTAWFKTDRVGADYDYIVAIGNNATDKMSSIGVVSGKLFASRYANAETTTAAHINVDTWYRFTAVITEGETYNTVDFYLNGVFVEQKTSSTAYSVEVGKLTIGVHLGNAINFTGAISDVQVWDRAWTAADVAYDYANPESLALNASGSALTESNLKLWYPMQDGHRGQQSYILDGANTGLGGAEVLLNADFSDNEPAAGNAYLSGGLQFSNWVENKNSGLRRFTKIPGGIRCDILEQSSQSYHTRIYSDILSLTEGQSYRFTAEVRCSVDGNFNARIEALNGRDSQPFPDVNTAVTNSEFSLVNHTFNYIPDSDGNAEVSDITAQLFPNIILPAGGFYEVRNVSLKAINDKHHATTVFYGDEMVNNVDFATSDLSDFTTTSGGTIEVEGGLLKLTDTSSTYCYTSAPFTTVVGRSYTLSIEIVDNSNTANANFIRIGTSHNNTSLHDVNYGVSYGVKTITVVAISTSTYITLITGAGVGEIGHWDNMSFKEVGVASGWTDADQQLHIPQTALQSYNELAWSGTHGKFVEVASLAAGLGTNNFAISYVINSADLTNDRRYFAFNSGASDVGRIVHKISPSGQMKIYAQDSDSTAVTYTPQSADGAISVGETYHIVESFDRSANLITTYINGVASGVTVDISSLDGTIHCNGDLEFNYWSETFVGIITEVALWKNTTLSAAEALELYNDGKPLDALTHTKASTLYGYWRNNGLSTWVNLANPGTKDTTTNSITETILIPEGVDTTRDSQGFLMNKKRSTSSLNLTTNTIEDGIGDGNMVKVGNVDLGTTDFSICFWAYKFRDWDEQWVISQYTDSSNRWYIRGNSSNPPNFTIFAVGSGSAVLQDTDNTSLDEAAYIENWMHVALTVDRSDTSNGIQWYINGEATSNGGVSAGQTGTSLSSTNNLTIGADKNPNFSDHHFDGKIDGVLVYTDRLLDETEVLKNYNATKRDHAN